MPNISLHYCYTQETGRVFASGTQALVRLFLEQARRDRQAGLNTRGLVSGYPGSPLAGLDHALHRAKPILDADGILFQPAANEELAATALRGSQHIHLYDQPDIDGVFGLWYGKGPGLDRSLDALRHANMGGVSPHGGWCLPLVMMPLENPQLLHINQNKHLSRQVCHFFIHDQCMISFQWGCRRLPCHDMLAVALD